MDERHPDRWDKVRQCETDVRPGRLTFKQQLLDIGEGRGDAWANDVAWQVSQIYPLQMHSIISFAIMHTENLF